jgi:DNA-binding transcriptional regulator LsrR (DeoR family)
MTGYDIELIIKVAEMYYLQDMPQRDIARRLNLSRPKVSRLLKAARELNIIEIKINYPDTRRSSLETIFEERFNLKEAVIVKSALGSYERTLGEVTGAAARYLKRAVKDGMSVGVAWGKTLKAVIDALKIDSPKYNVRVIQLIGSLGQSSTGPTEVARKLAEAFGGSYYLLPAPAIVNTSEIKKAIMDEAAIQEIINMAKAADVALVGIGNIDENSSFFTAGYLKKEDLAYLRERKAVGDICAHFYDIEGGICRDIEDRAITISFEEFKSIPLVVAVATGPAKIPAVLGALRSGAVDVLITDEQTASGVLKLAGNEC